MLTEFELSTIDCIYEKYKMLYGHFPQGYCGQLASEIQKILNKGELVAGYLNFQGFRREHWWLDIDGEIIDPMSDELMETDKHRHIEVHRDLNKKYWK